MYNEYSLDESDASQATSQVWNQEQVCFEEFDTA